MKRSLNTISLIAAIISFLAVVLTVINLFIVLIKNDFGNFLESIDVLVSIPFAILELSNGINILKIRGKSETSKELKPVFGLLNSILYGVAAEFIVSSFKSFYSSIFDGNYDLLSSYASPLFYVPIIIAFALIISTSIISLFLKRDRYSLIAKSGIIFSVLLIAFSIICCKPFKEGLISIIATVANYLVVISVAIYCAFAIVYYKGNHENIDAELLKDKDFEVVEKKKGSTKIKVYAERGEKSLITYIFVFLSLFLLAVGCLLIFTNQIIILMKVKSTTGNDYLNYVFSVLYLLISILFLVKVTFTTIKIIKKETNGIFSIPSLSKIRMLGMFYIVFDYLSLFIMVFNGGIKFSSLFTIKNIVPLLILIIPLLISIVGSKFFSKCNDTVRNGGALSEERFSYGTSVIIFYACSLPVMIYSLTQVGPSSLKFVGCLIISISFVFFIVYGILYTKRPLKEVFKEKTKVDLSKLN